MRAQVRAVDIDKKVDLELFRLAAEQTTDYAVFLLDPRIIRSSKRRPRRARCLQGL
jgi:hypothetical protein